MATPAITTQALWSWNTTGASPVVTGYPSGNNTKTGLQPSDLTSFCKVPLQDYSQNPPVPLQATDLINYIRFAEDQIEVQTGLLLTQTWIASPPAFSPQICLALGITPTFSGGYQQRGFDYDLQDSGYDFHFNRARDEGWLAYNLRYRPLQSINYTPFNLTAIKNTSFIYPLLNEFFNVPQSWTIEDPDFALVRFVPSTNVQMLPLFAMQLAFMGFAETVPNAVWLQYVAGLTPTDYSTRFAFVKQLVLIMASITALTNVQGTVNLGTEQITTQIDGVAYTARYDKLGPFKGVIEEYVRQRDHLMALVKNMTGPIFSTL